MEISSLDKNIEVKFGDIKLVDGKISLPLINGGKGHGTAERRINTHYKAIMRYWDRYANKVLAKEAKKQYDFLTKRGFIFHTYNFIITYAVTLNQDNTLSLYIDRGEYTGGANGVTVRGGDTWDTRDGLPIEIKAAVREKRKLLRRIRDEIAVRQSQGESYFEPVRKYVRKHYNPKQVYLTPEGLTVFYQETTIAPHSSGIVTFNVEERTQDVREPQKEVTNGQDFSG